MGQALPTRPGWLAPVGWPVAAAAAVVVMAAIVAGAVAFTVHLWPAAAAAGR